MKTKLILTLLVLPLFVTACGSGDKSLDAPTELPEPTKEPISSPTASPPLAATKTMPPVDTPTGAPPGGGGDDSFVTFTIASSHQVPPEDVLQEVTFYVGGGGEHPCKWRSYEQPTIIKPNVKDPELRDVLEVLSCGWGPQESVHTTLEFPDGSLISETQENTEWGVRFYYETDLDDPSGPYTFVFEGESERIEYTLNVVRPPGPRLYVEGDNLILYNFEPNERVRLFAYVGREGTMKAVLVGWQEFQVDFSGQLIVQPEVEATYIAVGEVSGETPLPPGAICETSILLEPRLDYVEADTESCPGAPPQQVHVDGRAWVCTKHDRLAVRAQPQRSSSEITRLEPGTYVTIIDGPACANNWSWWKIQTDSGTVGWVAEGGDDVDPYFLCPAR